jgi:hypothetical protein
VSTVASTVDTRLIVEFFVVVRGCFFLKHRTLKAKLRFCQTLNCVFKNFLFSNPTFKIAHFEITNSNEPLVNSCTTDMQLDDVTIKISYLINIYNCMTNYSNAMSDLYGHVIQYYMTIVHA